MAKHYTNAGNVIHPREPIHFLRIKQFVRRVLLKNKKVLLA